VSRADLQLHSDLGDGLNSPEEILAAAEAVGLDVIAITDHDDIRGSFQLRDIAAKRGSMVIVATGIEVTTRAGHLLALFVEDEIPMFRPLAEDRDRHPPCRRDRDRAASAVVPDVLDRRARPPRARRPR